MDSDKYWLGYRVLEPSQGGSRDVKGYSHGTKQFDDSLKAYMELLHEPTV